MKKKLLVILLTCALSVNFIGCGNSDSEKESQKSETESDESKDDLEALGDVEVEEKIFDVELTIPPEYVDGQTQEDLDKISDEHGFKSIVLNEDGSATYTMTKKQHKELMEEYREQINSSLDEMVGSENYPSFTKIEANDNFTEFTITTTSTELDMNESFSVMAFYMYGGLYAIFSGDDAVNVSVTFVNADTGNVIETANSSDMAEE